MESDMINSRNVIKLSLKLLTLCKYFTYVYSCNCWLGVRHVTELLPPPAPPTQRINSYIFITVLFLAHSVNCT